MPLLRLKVDPRNRLLEDAGQNCIKDDRRSKEGLQLRKERQRNDLVVIGQRCSEYFSDER